MSEVFEVQREEVTCSSPNNQSVEEPQRELESPSSWVGTWGPRDYATSSKPTQRKALKQTITFLKSVVLLFTSAPALSMADRVLGVPPGNKRKTL